MDEQNQYKLLQKLGAGGMGTVYKAFDTQLKRTVAIKLLHPEFLKDENAFRRFMREVEVSSTLDHPNIIKIFHAQMVGQSPQLVMELIDGKQLLEYIAEEKCTLNEKLRILLKVILAVDHAHKKKIIHRDIKPSNIMMRSNGEPVLMDFGIAKANKATEKSLTRSGEIVGTLQYMSPEQAAGIRKELDHRTDIYSLGAILYQLATDRLPITATTFLEMLDKIAKEEPIPLREIDPKIPLEVENICLKSLAKNKEDRYSTAKEMANDLENYLKGRSHKVQANIFMRRQKMWKTGKRFGIPLAIVLGIITIFAITFGIILPASKVRQEKEKIFENMRVSYKEAKDLIKSRDINSQQQSYQKLLVVWNIVQEHRQNLETENPQIGKEILKQLDTLGYDLGYIFIFQDDVERASFYFSSLQNILLNQPDKLEYSERLNSLKIPLAYLSQQYNDCEKELGKFIERQENFNNIAAKYPEIFLLMGKMYYKMYNYTKAISYLQRVAKQSYYLDVAYYQGLCHFYLKEFVKASELLEKVYKATSNNAKITTITSIFALKNSTSIYFASAILQDLPYEKPLPRESRNLISKIVEEIMTEQENLSEEEIVLYQEIRARYILDSLRYEPENKKLATELLELLQKAISDNPMRFSFYLLRGYAYRHVARYSEAWLDFEHSFELAPQQLDSLSQMWEIFPLCMDITQDYVEKSNSMFYRWANRVPVLAKDIFVEEFQFLHNQCRKELQGIQHIPFSQENFDRFYSGLSASTESVRNLSEDVLINMTPHQTVLDILAKKESSLTSSNHATLINNLKNQILKRKEYEQKIRHIQTLALVPHHGTVPVATCVYYQKNKESLQLLKKILTSEDTILPALREDWILLQYQAARVLAHLPKFEPDCGREFLFNSILQKKETPLELRIVVAKALFDSGMICVPREFLEDYFSSTPHIKHSKFLEAQIACLLLSHNKDHRQLLTKLIDQTKHAIIPVWVFCNVPFHEREFLQDRMEEICFKAVQNKEDLYVHVLGILSCKTIKDYRFSKGQHNHNDLKKILYDALQSKQELVQKTALFVLLRTRISDDNLSSYLEKLLNHSSDVRLLAVSLLTTCKVQETISDALQDHITFMEKMAMFYGLNFINNEQYMPILAVEFKKFLESNCLKKNRGLLLYFNCHFSSQFFRYLKNLEKAAFKMQMQQYIVKFLQDDDLDMLFWTLGGISRLDEVPPNCIEILKKLSKNNSLPEYIKKMVITALIAAYKQNPALSQEYHIAIKSDLKNNDLINKETLLSGSLFGYKQLLRNNKRFDFELLDFVDNQQIANFYLLKFKRNIVDIDFRITSKMALERIIDLLEYMGINDENEKSEYYEAIYYLAMLYYLTGEPKMGNAILEKNDLYLTVPKLAELWSNYNTILGKPLEAAYQKQIETQEERTNHNLAQWLRIASKLQAEKQNIEKALELGQRQYILDYTNVFAGIFLAESYEKIKNINDAKNTLHIIIYHDTQKSAAYFNLAKICGRQKSPIEADFYLEKSIDAFIPYPVSPEDLEDPAFEKVNKGRISFDLAYYAALYHWSSEMIIWLELAYKYQYILPHPYLKSYGTFDAYKGSINFQKAWKKLLSLKNNK